VSTTTAETVIRPARREDLERIAVIEESGAETFDHAGMPLADGSPPAPPDQWAATLDAGLLWVADEPGHGPIGFVAAEVHEGSLYIAEIDVLMERQQRGHGAALMRHAIAHARRRGLASVTLTTFRNVRWNAPFYAKLGFAELAPSETPPWLAAHIADETARGFEDRCAMRIAL
jgi:ribosomal protein S18 acetylase RimI-like enzyme